MNEPRNVSVDSDWLQHVLKAKDESEQARADLLAQHAAEKDLILEDLRAILRALGLSDGARPIPAHDVVLREILPAIHALATTAAERLRSVHTNVEFALTMAGDPVSRRESVHGAIDSALATTAARAAIESFPPDIHALLEIEHLTRPIDIDMSGRPNHISMSPPKVQRVHELARQLLQGQPTEREED